MAFVLAIDQGTTNSKALLLDEPGRIVKKASAPVAVSYPQPGWVEQSAIDIWHSVQAVATECLAAAEGQAIAAIGISNQRESVLIWDRRTGKPIGPSITWQCRRSAARIAALRTPGVEQRVRSITGLGLDPLFPAAKIGWLLDAYPEARARAARGELCAGTIDSWLVFKLTGGKLHATDFGNASRTQLFDIGAGAWSPELLALFDVPGTIMPDARSSNADFGVTDIASTLPPGIPIRAVMGDSHAALFGHGVRKPGAVKATYGTGSSLMTLTNGPVASRSGLSTTIAWRTADITAYALEGNITVSAQAAAWVASILGLPDAQALTRLAETVPDSGGVYFVPALAGLGAPHWRDQARAVFSGMSLATRPAHLARATLEAIALQVRDVFVAMESDAGLRLDVLNVDGGATDNDLLMQLEADILDRPLQRKAIAELSAAGVGAMAGAVVGLWAEAGPDRLGAVRDIVVPGARPEWRAALVDGWAAALRQAGAEA
jgi:glycerol kinase